MPVSCRCTHTVTTSDCTSLLLFLLSFKFYLVVTVSFFASHQLYLSRVRVTCIQVLPASGSRMRLRRQLDTLGGGHVPYGPHSPKHGSHRVGGANSRRRDRHNFLPVAGETAVSFENTAGGGSPYSQYLYELVDSSLIGNEQPLATLSRPRRHKEHHDDVISSVNSLLPARRGLASKIKGEKGQYRRKHDASKKQKARRRRRYRQQKLMRQEVRHETPDAWLHHANRKGRSETGYRHAPTGDFKPRVKVGKTNGDRISRA
jgi:hypothetical protein